VIDIGCPSDAAPFGLVCGRHFEFDISLPAGARQLPADVDAARKSSDDPVEQLTRVLLARYGGPVGAVATAVRPLNPPDERRLPRSPAGRRSVIRQLAIASRDLGKRGRVSR